MDGYYDVVDGSVVWRPYGDTMPDIIPQEVRTEFGLFEVVRPDQLGHTEEARLPDLGRSGIAEAHRMSGSSPPRRASAR